jgi:hypothetical protein
VISGIVEEFAQGAWIADIQTVEPTEGRFSLADEEWAGTVLVEKEDGGRWYSRLIAGAGGTLTELPDRYYEGTVTVSRIVEEICSASGEAFGSAPTDVVVTTYHRMKATAGQALVRLCATLGLVWWIDRSGRVHVASARPEPASAIEGIRTSTDTDGGVTLANTEGAVPGARYAGEVVKSIRWIISPTREAAACYFTEEIPPDPLDYLKTYTAKVERQNADGSVDVIVAGRFGVTHVQLLSGIPTSEIVLLEGDQVTLGFYGGDPRAPWAIATAQVSGGMGVVRVGDEVALGEFFLQMVPGPSGSSVLYWRAPGAVLGVTPWTPIATLPSAPLPATPGTPLTGKASQGSDRVKLS